MHLAHGYGGKEGKGDGLVLELQNFTFMLQIYVSRESPDTEKKNQQVGKKKTITHMQNPTNYSDP